MLPIHGKNARQLLRKRLTTLARESVADEARLAHAALLLAYGVFVASRAVGNEFTFIIPHKNSHFAHCISNPQNYSENYNTYDRFYKRIIMETRFLLKRIYLLMFDERERLG